jgi:hypothetical protein
MAPILKSRRRADAEIKELNQWFSTVLDDQSHFMRYENITYPELTFEEANAGHDDCMIDDEYHTGHQIWNFRQIEELTGDQDQQSILHYNPSNSQRWKEFRIAFPLIITTTTAMMLLPLFYELITMVFFGLTSWFFNAEQQYLNPEEALERRTRAQVQNENDVNNDNNKITQLDEHGSQTNDHQSSNSNSNITINDTNQLHALDLTRNDHTSTTTTLDQHNQPTTPFLLDSILISSISTPSTDTSSNTHHQPTEPSEPTLPQNHSNSNNNNDYQPQVSFQQPVDYILHQEHQEKQRQQYIHKVLLDPTLPTTPIVHIKEEIDQHRFIMMNSNENKIEIGENQGGK